MMAVSPGSRARVRMVAWSVVAMAASSMAALASASCINFDGLDGQDLDGAVLEAAETSIEAGAAGCEAGVQSDPLNCGSCGHVCAFRVNSYPVCANGQCALGCNGNFGNCDGVDDNGCETQLASDPKNCGACGRDCAGGACASGQCQPVVLATNQSSPQALALDGTNVYWGALYNYTVDRIAKDGGPYATIASNEVYPAGVAVDSANLYWVDRGYGAADGLVRKVPIAGGAASSVVAGLSSRPTAIVVSGTELYYATLGNQGPTDGTIVAVPIANVPDAGAGAVLANGQNNPNFLAVDAQDVYWTNYGSAVAPDAGAQNGSVMKCAVPSCAGGAQPVATAQNHPRGIAIDAQNVYWTSFGTGQNDGAVMKCAKSGCAGGPTVLAGNLVYPDSIAVDPKYVYYTTRSGQIQRVPVAGGAAPEPMTTVPQSFPLALAVDDKFLYFSTQSGPSGGSIQKLLK